jgi:integrase
MAKRVRDAVLESRAAREKLSARGKPYYKSIAPGLHVGYRKGKTGGRWVARHYIGEQDYVVETIADADDRADADGVRVLTFWQAQEAARALQTKRSGGTGKVSAVYTVADAVADYLQSMSATMKSHDDAKYRANAHILPALGKADVAKLTAKEIRDWLQAMSKAPRRLRTKPGTEMQFRDTGDGANEIRQRRASANRVLTILKAALNYAWREGKVASDHEWRRVEPFEDVETARVRYLTIDEAKRLINATEGRFRDLVQAALQTGARYGELARLRVEDFNRDVGTLTIKQSKSGPPRHIVLTEEGQAFFDAATAGRAHDALIFTTEAGDDWKDSQQARPMSEACKNARISPPIGFHGLRHTWASHAVMNGVPLIVVAENLGHSTTRMVEKHYGHLSASFKAAAIRAGAPRFGTTSDGNVVSMQGRG